MKKKNQSNIPVFIAGIMTTILVVKIKDNLEKKLHKKCENTSDYENIL